ncbi:MAG: hypothetical protein JNG84_00380, partial [Archangium sp.]|nr:hypothetical protein [Archangium sp.]
IQLTPSGRTVMRCTLDGSDTGSVGFNGQTVAIADGETIRFYDVGMLGIGQHGWVAPRGRPEGTGLAR